MRSKYRSTMMRVLAITLVLALTAPLAGCRKKGPAEKAGEEVDEAVEDIGDAIDDATD